MKGTIFFIPQLRYISHDTFFGLADHLADVYTVYIDTGLYEQLESSISEDDKKNILNSFNAFERIEIINSEVSNGIRLKNYRHWIEELYKLVDTYNPNAFIIPTDVNFVFRVLKMHFPKIQRIVVQPSVRFNILYKISWLSILKYIYFNLILKVPIIGYRPNFGGHCHQTHYFIWGDKWRTSDRLRNDSGVHVTGAIKYDNFNKEKIESDNSQSFFNSIAGNKRIVSIYLNKSKQIGIDAFLKYIDLYKLLINNRKDLYFVIKVHPMENLELCQKAFGDSLGENGLLSKDIDSTSLLAQSHIMITHWSSVLYDSIMTKTPFILLNPNGQFDFLMRNLSDYPYIAKNVDEINNMINNILLRTVEYDESIDHFVQESLFKIDDQSGIRAAKEVYKIIE